MIKKFEEFINEGKGKNKSPKKKTKEVEIYTIYPGSTLETFEKWMNECSKQLQNFSGIFSVEGSDGPDIRDTGLKDGKLIPFNQPEAIDKYLEEHGYYDYDEHFGYDDIEYFPPTKRYFEWLKEKHKI